MGVLVEGKRVRMYKSIDTARTRTHRSRQPIPSRVNPDVILLPSANLRCQFSKADRRFKRHPSSTCHHVCCLLSLDHPDPHAFPQSSTVCFVFPSLKNLDRRS